MSDQFTERVRHDTDDVGNCIFRLRDGNTRTQLQGTPEDMTAINAVIVEMTEGFNKHDAVAASRMYTSDAEFTNVAGMTKGAAEIEKFLAAGFRTRLKLRRSIP